jgi:hypothetical protein
VIREVGCLVLGMGLPPRVLAQLLDDMSTIEWRLAAGCSEKVNDCRNNRPSSQPKRSTASPCTELTQRVGREALCVPLRHSTPDAETLLAPLCVVHAPLHPLELLLGLFLSSFAQPFYFCPLAGAAGGAGWRLHGRPGDHDPALRRGRDF